MADLFKERKQGKASTQQSYTAEDIEVLEGLEPVRRRPGMYIGGTDEIAMQHLVHEIFDNSMDEAVAGYATRIEIEVKENNVIIISDNGRGIPIDPHPKFPKRSALEVILTTLHAGGKFGGKAYETSGGLHGVGISVVNALAEEMEIEVVRNKEVYHQAYSRGEAVTKLKKIGMASNRKGTTVAFRPDTEIFGTKAKFKPDRLYKFARSKAFLFKGTEVRWKCDKVLLAGHSDVPEEETIHFPGGLKDFLDLQLKERGTVTSEPFYGEAKLADNLGRIEWAIAWPVDEEEHVATYCNTIPTPDGGTHETGLRSAMTKGLKAYGDLVGNRKAGQLSHEDIIGSAVVVISLFLKDPQFQGQTKNKLVSSNAARLVENAIRDHFDHWLSGHPDQANNLLNVCIEHSEERLRRRQDKAVSRKAVTQKLRLPGKLADCSRNNQEGTELFIVEGDSAGGSAKQARNRETQAILPLRGKILNVASASLDKIRANQELSDLVLAMGCGSGKHFNEKALRYEKIIIMTDADVDGAHIASLLMTFFFQEMPQIIHGGHLYLAQPPLFRITQSNQSYYAQDEREKEKLVEKLQKKQGKIDVGRFKGLGEMTPAQLKETTMDPSKRILLKASIDASEEDSTAESVEKLMGRKPEHRFHFIQEQTAERGEQIRDNLDV